MKFILYGKTDCKHCEEAKVEIRKFLEQLPDSYHGEIFDIFFIDDSGKEIFIGGNIEVKEFITKIKDQYF